MRPSFRPLFAPDTGAATADDTGADTNNETSGDGDASGGDAADEIATGDAADQDWSGFDPLQNRWEVDDRMDEVGAGMPGQREDDEEAEEDLEEDETDQPEGEQDIDDDAEGEQEDLDDEPETDEDEVAEEDLEEEADDDTRAEPVSDEVREIVSEHFPSRVVETTEQLDDTLDELRQTAEVYDLLDRVVEEDSSLETYLELRLQEDVSPRVAATQAFADLLEAPDPEEDLEAYVDWKAEQKLQEQEKENGEAEEEDFTRVEETFKQESARSLERFKAQHDVSDEDAERLVAKINRLVFGDPQGHVPSDQIERLSFAVNKKQILEQEREEARQEGYEEGRQEAIEEMEERQRGDGLPKPGGSRSAVDERTDREKELAGMANSFREADAEPEDFAW